MKDIAVDSKDIAVDSETVCLWLVDHSYDRTIKTLCCRKLNWNVNYFLSILWSSHWEIEMWKPTCEWKNSTENVFKIKEKCFSTATTAFNVQNTWQIAAD